MSDVIDDLHDEIQQLREALEFEVNANNTMSSLITQISDENERLRAALRLAAIDVFAQCDPLRTSPDQLVQHYIDEGRR